MTLKETAERLRRLADHCEGMYESEKGCERFIWAADAEAINIAISVLEQIDKEFASTKRIVADMRR